MNIENQNIEYKESWRDEYLKWVCGFANAQGGKLYIGIDDGGTICGVENAHRLSEDIPNKIVALLGIVADVNFLNQEGKLLLFTKNPRRYFTGTEFKIGRFHSNIADLTSQEMIEGSIIQMADRVVRMLKDKFLTMPIHYEGLQRIESLEVPEDALREILYNAICHKDYLGPQIQMRVWDHHVEIWNDGELPAAITPENIEKVHASYPRNKNLAFVFYKAGFIESWGRGWQKICDGFQAAGLPKPTIESTQGGVLVTFQRNNVNLKMTNGTLMDENRVIQTEAKEDNHTENIAESIVENIVEKLSAMRGRIVKIVWKNPYASAQSISEVVGIAPRNVQEHLRKLQAQGIIRRVGPDKGGHWEIIKEK